ncbi:MAG TPA: DJ-1/PfpI family protein [Chitinophagaceae bacterium]|nr:DJ-1/PfpI family protein [Chitinophagaceae bacterium]
MIIGMIIFPNLTQLDLTGPYEVFGRLPDTKVLLIAENLQPVKSDNGLLLTPDATFETSPQVDVLFAPGGRGIFDAMQNKKLISFLQQQSVNAEYITSVCTGSLILAAAGLLNGYKATTHWLSLDLLKLFNVEVVEERVVIDRNRITGSGVTAGIDFGLYVVAKLFNEDVAKEVQLMLEYNPAPPFNAGSPKTADKEIVDRVVGARKDIQKQRAELIKKLLKEAEFEI